LGREVVCSAVAWLRQSSKRVGAVRGFVAGREGAVVEFYAAVELLLFRQTYGPLKAAARPWVDYLTRLLQTQHAPRRAAAELRVTPNAGGGLSGFAATYPFSFSSWVQIDGLLAYPGEALTKF
jgi:hypothetical protein